jgi:hypothetical protein
MGFVIELEDSLEGPESQHRRDRAIRLFEYLKRLAELPGIWPTAMTG